MGCHQSPGAYLTLHRMHRGGTESKLQRSVHCVGHGHAVLSGGGGGDLLAHLCPSTFFVWAHVKRRQQTRSAQAPALTIDGAKWRHDTICKSCPRVANSWDVMNHDLGVAGFAILGVVHVCAASIAIRDLQASNDLIVSWACLLGTCVPACRVPCRPSLLRAVTTCRGQVVKPRHRTLTQPPGFRACVSPSVSPAG
jgi:hypothetical protein